MTPLKDQAIQTALSGDWQAAITLNKELLKQDPNDIEAMNRLAFALHVIGKTKEAKNTYQKVLEIDHQNLIALKNLKRISANKGHSGDGMNAPLLSTQSSTIFLEESGKTKVVELINVAEPKFISHLIAGETVQLRIKRLKIFILDRNNQYLGMLPDNIGKRLLRFATAGNEYEAYIKSVEDNHKISIFIRETKRASSLRTVPSFITNEKQQDFEKSLAKNRGKSTDHDTSEDDSA